MFLPNDFQNLTTCQYYHIKENFQKYKLIWKEANKNVKINLIIKSSFLF